MNKHAAPRLCGANPVNTRPFSPLLLFIDALALKRIQLLPQRNDDDVIRRPAALANRINAYPHSCSITCECELRNSSAITFQGCKLKLTSYIVNQCAVVGELMDVALKHDFLDCTLSSSRYPGKKCSQLRSFLQFIIINY